MAPYKNKSKCGYNCKKRAKWKALGGNSPHDIRYACNDHKSRLDGFNDVLDGDSEKLTEADYQTWMSI